MPTHHGVRPKDVFVRRLHGTLAAAAERGPVDFPDLLLTPGVGARTVRSLAMVAEVVHGAPYRFADPARFSLAHGGKDRHPYPVPIKVYDRDRPRLEVCDPSRQARARRGNAGCEAPRRPGSPVGANRTRTVAGHGSRAVGEPEGHGVGVSRIGEPEVILQQRAELGGHEPHLGGQLGLLLRGGTARPPRGRWASR